MGASYLRLNIAICGVNQINQEMIYRVFPKSINANKRELIREEDKIHYTARIFRGEIEQNNLNIIREYINNNFDYIQNIKKEFPKNVLIYFSDENATLQRNFRNFVRIANNMNILPELKLPFIAFLCYGEINEIRQRVQVDIFGDFQDKRKITILKLMRTLDGNDEDRRRNREINYRKILSYLWEMTLILNQKPFILSKTPEANFFRINEEVPTVTINILICGFSRKGKSTFINMIFDKMATLENPSFLPVTSEIVEFLFPCQPGANGIVKGGLKLFDVPGLIEGTTQNMKKIEKMVAQSIENQEYNFDVINYILFFYLHHLIFNIVQIF